VAGQIELRDGESQWAEVREAAGGEVLFSFHLMRKEHGKDLEVATTVFSDWAAPDLYMSAGVQPTRDSFQFASRSWGAAEIDISPNQLKDNATYYILAVCETFCRFTITVHYIKETKLMDGVPLQCFLLHDQSRLYYFSPPAVAQSLTIEAVPIGITDNFDMYVAAGRVTGQVMEVNKSWYRGKRCHLIFPSSSVYWISVIAIEAVEFIIKAYTSVSAIELMADFPTADMLAPGQWQYYKFYADDDQEDIFIMRTIYSGDMDMYVRAGGLPSKTDYTLRAGHNDTITLEAKDRREPGTYYIGLLAQSPCSFLLAVSMNRLDFMPLFPGLSQVGIVAPNELFYFYMDVPVQSRFDLVVSLHPASGAPDMYLKLCKAALDSAECRLLPEEISFPEQYPGVEYAKGVQGNEQIAFLHREDMCPGTLCRYIVCVAGQPPHTSTFTLVATYSHSFDIYLRDSVPVSFSIPAQSLYYFTYQSLDPSAYRIDFQLTTISGLLNMCVSNKTPRPQGKECMKTANRTAEVEERVDFSKGIGETWVNGSYYVTIRADSAASFSLLAHEQVPSRNTTIALYPGQTQRDRLVKEPGGGFRLYSFEIRYTNETKRAINIVLTPYSGRFHLYVANSDKTYDQSKGLFAFNWSTEVSSSHNYLSNTLRIVPTDPAYLLNSVYSVLVLPIDWNSDNTTSYSIMYTSGEGLITLSEGVQAKDNVENGQYRYYLFPVAGLNESITIFLTESSGDPDLYVSFSPSIVHPSSQHYDWAGERYGGETVTIDWTEERRAVCRRTNHICGIYISVYGYTEAAYSLLIKTRPDQLILMEKGPILRGELGESQYSLYYSPINIRKPLTVSIEPVLGRSQVSLRTSPDPTYSSGKASFSAEANMTAAIIYLTSEMYSAACKEGCYADLKVECKSAMCRFELVVTQDEEVQLTAGKPVSALCDHDEVVYFSYFNSLESTNLVVSLTAQSGGNPDLYVSKGERPVPERAQWQSTDWHSDLVQIPSAADMRGEYYIGVACDTDTSFSIAVTSGQTPLTRLSNSRAFSGFLPATSSSFFYYINDLQSALTLTLTPRSGKAALYVCVHNDQLSDIFESLPTPLNYTWKSDDTGRVVISPGDPYFCTDCAILIAVVTESVQCEYTIIVHNAEQFTILPNGIPVRIHLSARSSRLIAYDLVDYSDLELSMTVYGGEPALYLSPSPMVSRKEFTWTTARSGHVEHIHIGRESQNYRMGWYYGVIESGDVEASFAITAHSRDSYVRLVDGWPQTYSISYNALDRLIFRFDVRNESAVCRLNTWTSNMRPKVYVGYGDGEEFVGLVPGPGNSNFTFEEYDVFGVLEMNLPRLGIGRYTLSVYSSPQDGFLPSDIADFQLVCSSSSALLLISLSDKQYGFLDTFTQSRRYELRVAEEGELLVWLVPCWGSVDLEVAANSTAVDVKTKRVEDGTIKGSIQAKAGAYFITVRGLNASELVEGVNYQLTTELLTPTQPSTQRLFPGNSGLIQWKELSSTTVRLYWSPPETASGDPIPAQSIVYYRVYATRNSSVLMTTACGMAAGEDLGVAWLPLSAGEELGDTEVTIELESDKTITVNIMAIAGIEEEFILENVPYVPIEVMLTGQHYLGYIYRLIFAAGGLIVALLLGAFYLFIKSRQINAVTMQLTEMVPISVQRQIDPRHRTARSSNVFSARDTTGLMQNIGFTSEPGDD
jgi:hypothetical protein